jgi:protein TonB
MQRIRPPRPCEPQATEPPQPIAAAQFEQSAAADAVASPEVPVVVPGDNPAPDYPAAAVRRRLEGTVTIEIQVDAAGTAHQCRVLQTTGYGLLDDAALAAARRWRFDRGPGTVQVPFAFRLHRRG